MSIPVRVPHLLEITNLSTAFETHRGVVRAVDGVSLHVDAGESLGIVGESGAGKTVTALSVLGLVDGVRGRVAEGSSVRLRGEELVGASPRRLREVRGNEIAMIFQEPAASLNPVYTVGAQIVEALRLHRRMGRIEARAEAIRLLDEVGIPDPAARVDEYPHRLSGGMSQRVMIAMALSCDPAVLIADEPTTALDPTVQAQILDLLARLRAQRGMALVLISHDLAVVADVCERIVVMYAGRVIENGTVEEVFARPGHPYTSALIDAIPSTRRGGGPLLTIPGSIPSPTAWPEGCRFRPRCPLAFHRCLEEPALLRVGGSDRAARCWLAAEGASAVESEAPR